jgi:hypothetical protein
MGAHMTEPSKAALAEADRSGITGVHWNTKTGKWRSAMQTDGRKIHLGYFDVLNDAAVARKVAEIKYGFHQNHGSAPA